jgi:phosphoribosylaminoimidazolecarboxamide formyltransferase/IMP cyclohydrolase
LAELGKGLAKRGFELVSTGGTSKALAQAGLTVLNVSDVTGFPEMMDGRVKTLHPKIHGGILARRDRPDDVRSARTHGISLIDVIVVNLYPFAETAARPGVTFEQLIEEVDIGGPSLVRAAAKNFKDVLVVVEPSDYPRLLRELDRTGGPSLEFRFQLAVKAFMHTALYDTMIADTLGEFSWKGGTLARVEAEPVEKPTFTFEVEKLRDLRYGENPHQKGSLWEPPDEPIGLTFIQGKELSFTNLLDLDAAWRIVAEFDEPAAAVIKHTNPCGAATGKSAADAYVRARDADALSAFGGIVGLNRPLDAETARAITSTFVEAIIAPSVEQDALKILAAKDKMRVVTLPPLEEKGDHTWRSMELRSVFGGLLMQERDRVIEARIKWPAEGFPKVVTRRQPTPEEWQALRFAWRICAHIKSNTIVFTDAQKTLAVGAGQMSRVDAVKVAAMKAGETKVSLKGSVAASDAFFPFRDGLDAIAAAGATAVVQPGGSVNDAKVIAAADEHGIAMVFTGKRHFRH